MAKDEPRIRAINEGRDVHCDTAATYLGEPYEQFNSRYLAGDKEAKKVRDIIKNVVYGCVYGHTEVGLCVWLNGQGMPTDRAKAKQIQDAIMGTKPAILEWIDRSKWDIRRNGYAETFFGRRIYYPDVKDDRGWVREKALREGVNARVQGSAADLTKIAMTTIWKEKKRRGLRSLQWAAVHDEGDEETPTEEIDELTEIIHRAVPASFTGPIPIEVGVGTGDNWAAAK